MVILISSACFAFKPAINVLSKAEIGKLSDQALNEAYIDVEVEIDALKTFHTTSGFMPKDYEKFKEILRYRIFLIQEMDKRNIDVPRVR